MRPSRKSQNCLIHQNLINHQKYFILIFEDFDHQNLCWLIEFIPQWWMKPNSSKIKLLRNKTSQHVTRSAVKGFNRTEWAVEWTVLSLCPLFLQKLFGSHEPSSVQLWVSYNRQPMKAAQFMTRHPITVSFFYIYCSNNSGMKYLWEL